MKKSKTSSIIGISSATFLSRILGLIREQIFAFLLGATNFADAFLVAFRIPNLLRDLFAEGALSTSFIPTFTQYVLKKGEKKAFYLSNLVINFLIMVIGFLIILGYIFTPQIVRFMAPGFSLFPEKFSLTIMMTKILLPFLLFVSLASVFMGMLNVYHKFFIPAFAPAMFNLTIILGGLIIFLISPSSHQKAVLWAMAAFVGGFIQLAIQIPSACRLGYKYKFCFDLKFKEEGLKRIFNLMLPAIIGLAAVQINIIINTMLASFLPTGSVSYLNYAFRLIQFPIGLFGVAIATVTTAYISRDIVKNDISQLNKNIADSLKLNSFLSFPALVYFFLLGQLIIELLFEHGQFKPRDTLFTYQTLQFYCLALFFYSGVKIMAPVFYAANKSHIAVISSISAVVTNLAVSLSTYRVMGVKGLALGLSCGSFVNFLVLSFNYTRHFGWIKDQNILSGIGKHALAAIVMGIAGLSLYQWLKGYKIIVSATGTIILCGGFYFFLNYLFKSAELEKFFRIIKSFIKKKK
ncbi:MAG: murein biosynthesis integral membrane protein MurJ [Spirochaetes bacterium]|nr:murein biosynthesis integral membrane protein MurJ [Spirochaetota bacterium]